jgi:speckle-type POZ protein
VSDQHLVATTNLPPRPAVHYEWRLTGVTKELFTAAAVGSKLKSPPFSAHGLEWRLELYPKDADEMSEGHISIFVRLHTQNATATPRFSVGAGAEPDFELEAGLVFNTCTPRPEGSGMSWGYEKYLSHKALLDAFDTHVPGGVLTVRCTLRAGGALDATSPIVVPAPSLTAGLSALLVSGVYADVTLVCGGERLPAHSLVLRMRSPVFAAQLSEGPLQADASAVPVPPDITPHTLKRLLQFLYTDELEPASPEEATHLLNAADHYGLRRLFAICERALRAALSIDNAADTLTLADQHSASALKHAALRFVAANAVAVMATPGWAHLVTSRPPLVLETMHTLATGAPPAPPARLAPADDADGGAAGVGADTQRPCKRAR